jgi:hypothetical protein
MYKIIYLPTAEIVKGFTYSTLYTKTCLQTVIEYNDFYIHPKRAWVVVGTLAVNGVKINYKPVPKHLLEVIDV